MIYVFFLFLYMCDGLSVIVPLVVGSLLLNDGVMHVSRKEVDVRSIVWRMKWTVKLLA